MKPILEVKNLSVSFGSNEILKDISFQLNEGEIAAIIGPNGAGKTTLFKAILGFIPYKGEIKWLDSISFGYVPQKLEFDRTFPLTVKELFLLKSSKYHFWFPATNINKLILDSLEQTSSTHMLNKRIGQLSAGEVQRVFIAYAIFGKPKLLLFDEPTSGIDIGGELTVYSFLHKIAKETNMTILMISHDISIVFEHVDQVICLNKDLYCYGAPQKILTPEQLQKLYGGPIAFYEHEH